MKTRTCSRCKGTGLKNTTVFHCGVPGLCYGCNGSGCQKWVDAATVTAERHAARAKHIAELEQGIAECKAALDANKAAHRRVFERELAHKQQVLANLAAVEPAAGEWRPAPRAAVEV